jgi:hypothetical protein
MNESTTEIKPNKLFPDLWKPNNLSGKIRQTHLNYLTRYIFKKLLQLGIEELDLLKVSNVRVVEARCSGFTKKGIAKIKFECVRFKWLEMVKGEPKMFSGIYYGDGHGLYLE